MTWLRWYSSFSWMAAILVCSIWIGSASRLTTKWAGASAISTSITRPIPFWPSLEPWVKLMPIDDTISMKRAQNGGCLRPSICWR
ncbi:hypothetical protein D3C78_1644510 [compost metagenome]